MPCAYKLTQSAAYLWKKCPPGFKIKFYINTVKLLHKIRFILLQFRIDELREKTENFGSVKM